MLLPVRTAVLNYLYQVEEADINGIMKALEPMYGKEKQFNKKMFLEHVMSLEANGLVEMKGYELDPQGELVLCYVITADGRRTVEKYIPAKHRQKERLLNAILW